MSDHLERRIRSHMYAPNPAITDYLSGQRTSANTHQALSELVTVRERQPSVEPPALDWTDVTAEQAINNPHNRCITPCDDYNSICCICHSVAINPFRCTGSEELINTVIDYNEVYERPHHICCYQCLTENMLNLGTDRFECPMCRINEFNVNRLIGANNETIREGEKYLICCTNNCGLMGTPLALAHHICPLADYKQVGHTSMSNILLLSTLENTRLTEEMVQIRAEMRGILENYNRRKDYSLEWEDEYHKLLDYHMKHINQMVYQLNMSEQMNGQLISELQMKDREIQRLNEKKNETINECKSKLKFLGKLYKTRVEELSDERDRAFNELVELLEVNYMEQRSTAPNDSAQLDSEDEQTLSLANIFLFDNSAQTVGSSDGETGAETD